MTDSRKCRNRKRQQKLSCREETENKNFARENSKAVRQGKQDNENAIRRTHSKNANTRKILHRIPHWQKIAQCTYWQKMHKLQAGK